MSGAVLLTNPLVKAVLVLDLEGARIFAKYYDLVQFPDIKTQMDFENSLKQKSVKVSTRMDAEVLMFDGLIVLYKVVNDTIFYVISTDKENELIMQAVLSAIEDSMSNLLRGSVDKGNLIQHLDLLMLVVDETIDDGMILEIESEQIASRATMRGMEHEVPLAEQTLKQALKIARDQVFKPFRT